MRKTIYLLLLCATSLLFSCLEDDFDRTSIQETIQNADREERFFLMRDYSANGMSSVPNNFIGNNFIEKLKSFNQKNHFVCELSDQKGLPLWQYAFRTENAVQNKDGNDGQDFLIIPMQEEGNLYLSSLLYIKFPDSENPEIYTITNDELLTFIQDQNVEKYDRESVLMTFFYFDQQIFGGDKVYTGIPLDLFEQIPEVEEEDNHDSGGEGLGYKEFSFEINEDVAGRVAIVCADYYHCTGCVGPCDGCGLCVSTICHTITTGGFGGNNYGGGNNNGGGSNGGGDGGSNGNNYPWYFYYPNYENYTHHFRNFLSKLFPEVVISTSQVNYLMDPDNIELFHNLNSYLGSSPTTQKKKFIRDVISFVYINRNTIVQKENILQRINALGQYLYDNPYAISNIPCNQIPQWQEVVQHQVPQSVKDKLILLNQMRPGQNYDFALQSIENAAGSLVNNDYFAVTFDHLPNKPAPHDNEQFTAEEFLSYVRVNIDDFVNTNLSSFTPSPFTGINESQIWYSSNPVNSVIHINIPGNDGSVITSGHQSNPNNSHWIFTTIQTPFIIVTPGADGPHPVSGHRKFGLKKNSNGSYTFYTRGVDRVQDKLDIILLGGDNNAIKKADPLWESFQEGLREYIQDNNTYSNTVIKETPVTWRPNWTKVNNVLINNAPLSTLGCQ